MADEAGLVVAGRYRLIDLVGQGGMGQVWRCHDDMLDREVAVKQVLLPSDLPESAREIMVERTRREARTAARLHHPGIVTVHDVIDHDGAPWIVMEYVRGTSLGSLISRQGSLDWLRVTEIGIQVTEALEHAHAAGVIHRDLKPDNILLAENRSVITDFGIARIDGAASRITRTNEVIGTPQYMSPEHLAGKELTAASDMWSLGATLYEAVEGHPPFDGGLMATVITAVLTQQLPTPSNAGPLAELLATLLAKDFRKRPDAATTVRRLREITTRATTPTGAAPQPDRETRSLVRPWAPTVHPGRPARWTRRRRLTLVLSLVAATMCVALAVTLLVINNRGSSDNSANTPKPKPPSAADCAAVGQSWTTFRTSWDTSAGSHAQQVNASYDLYTSLADTQGGLVGQPTNKFYFDLVNFMYDANWLNEAENDSQDQTVVNNAFTKLGSDDRTIRSDCS